VRPKPKGLNALINTDVSIERRKVNEAFRKYILEGGEVRDLSSASGGYLIPTQTFGTLAENVKQFAPIVDVVTVEENTTGRPTQFVTYDPTGNALTISSEGSAPSEQDFTATKSLLNHDTASATTRFSNQLLSDSSTFDLIAVLNKSALKQLGRNLDYNVVAGTDPLGNIMPNSAKLLATAPVAHTTATLAGGIGWAEDLVPTIQNVDPGFLSKSSWVMSYGTYIYLLSQKTSTGSRYYPELTEMKLGSWPVVISAAMPQTLSASNVQILFGDLSQVGLSYTGLAIRVLRERLAELNMSALVAYSRVASTLMIPGAVKALKLGT
jgi:HK97 family phage major capsid protein